MAQALVAVDSDMSTQLDSLASTQSWADELQNAKSILAAEAELEGTSAQQGKLIEAMLSKLGTIAPLDPSKSVPKSADNDDLDAAPAGSLERDFADAIKQNTFDMRGRLGRLWAAAKKSNADVRKQYASCKGYEAQREFRIKWAAENWKAHKQQRIKSETSTRSDVGDGTYTIFSVLLEKLGQNMSAARNYAMTCMEMHSAGKTADGRPWVQTGEMTKMIEFLFIEKKFVQTSTEAWQLRSVETTDDEPKQKKAKIQPKNATSKPAQSKSKVPDADADEEHDGPSLDEQLRKAKALKTQMLATTSASSDLLRTIESEETWAWANNPAILAGVHKAIKDLNVLKGSTPFWKTWVVNDDFTKFVKKAYDHGAAVGELRSLSRMAEVVDALRREVRVLKSMHAARV